jgi:hypothetical protein
MGTRELSGLKKSLLQTMVTDHLAFGTRKRNFLFGLLPGSFVLLSCHDGIVSPLS